jgi:hypothetical protein
MPFANDARAALISAVGASLGNRAAARLASDHTMTSANSLGTKLGKALGTKPGTAMGTKRDLVHRRPDGFDRADAATPLTDRELFDAALASRDPAKLQRVRNWGAFNEQERMQALNALHGQGWAGPLDEYAMEAIWGSFGSNVAQVAARNLGVWEACMARGAELADLPALQQVRVDFESDVRQTAKSYMALNLAGIQGEMETLGLNQTPGTAEGVQDSNRRLDELQQLLRDVELAQEAANALKRIPVGYNVQTHRGGTEFVDIEVPALFDPESAPDTTHPGDGKADWSAVKGQWDRVQAVLTSYAGMSPAVYTSLRDKSTGRIAHASPEEARRLLAEQLEATDARIRATQPKIDSGDLDWRDLKPIHQQLYGGKGAPSGRPWSNRFYKSIGEDVIGDHEGMATLLAVGGGLLAGALFVIAEVASAGAATPMAVAMLQGAAIGVGVGQAAASWENYADLRTAANASASPDTELVTQGQADAALVSAIIAAPVRCGTPFDSPSGPRSCAGSPRSRPWWPISPPAA